MDNGGIASVSLPAALVCPQYYMGDIAKNAVFVFISLVSFGIVLSPHYLGIASVLSFYRLVVASFLSWVLPWVLSWVSFEHGLSTWHLTPLSACGRSVSLKRPRLLKGRAGCMSRGSHSSADTMTGEKFACCWALRCHEQSISSHQLVFEYEKYRRKMSRLVLGFNRVL